MDESAARSESAVDDSAPMIMTKKTASKIPGRYDAAICGIRLLTSPSIGSIPRYRARTPSIPTPMTVAPYPTVAVMKVGLIRSSWTANRRWAMVWLPIA